MYMYMYVCVCIMCIYIYIYIGESCTCLEKVRAPVGRVQRPKSRGYRDCNINQCQTRRWPLPLWDAMICVNNMMCATFMNMDTQVCSATWNMTHEPAPECVLEYWAWRGLLGVGNPRTNGLEIQKPTRFLHVDRRVGWKQQNTQTQKTMRKQ